MSCASPLLTSLHAVTRTERVFTVVSEYLGYLPYGQYLGVLVDGVDVTDRVDSLSEANLRALEDEGRLERIDHQQLNADDWQTTYRILR